jgi:hypothetical protein
VTGVLTAPEWPHTAEVTGSNPVAPTGFSAQAGIVGTRWGPNGIYAPTLAATVCPIGVPPMSVTFPVIRSPHVRLGEQVELKLVFLLVPKCRPISLDGGVDARPPDPLVGIGRIGVDDRRGSGRSPRQEDGLGHV